MRSLTQKQKKLIRYAAEKFKQETGKYPLSYYEIDPDDLEEIDSLNPCEIFYQNVDRFLWDEYWGKD